MKRYMEDVSVEDAIKAGRTDTICWDCKNAIGGGCSWADPELAVPVKGWTATKTESSFIVHACPKFDRCGYGSGRYRTADDYILALEIALKERKVQLAKLKKMPDNFRKLNARLKKKNAKLQDQLDKEQWLIACHYSE